MASFSSSPSSSERESSSICKGKEKEESRSHLSLSSSEIINSNKWEGKSKAEIKDLTAEQTWWMIADEFCSLHKWLPAIDTCHRVEGSPGEPGLIRRCGNSSASTWAEEKLVSIDRQQKQLSYEVLDNNVGFHNYVATIKVSPLLQGCEIEWAYELDPVEGLKLEDLRAYIDSCLHGMAHNMMMKMHHHPELN